MIPTYKCNFACKYCFEDLKRLEQVREDVIKPQLLVAWIEKFWSTYKFPSLGIVFYGGEPLLKKERLKDYIEALKKWTNANKIKFSFSIITNGSLWDKEFAQYMVKNGLKQVQITIDGVKEVHDARRPFKGEKGSFV
ncbi:MAG: radical SAM protein [Candidatus Cloacimonadia bacterium]